MRMVRQRDAERVVKRMARKVNEIVSAGIAEKLNLTGGDGFHMHPPADETRNGFMTIEDRILLKKRTSEPTPSTLMERDSTGQSKVGTPIAPDHIARKQEIDSHVLSPKAHPAQHIPYSGAVFGANNTKQAIDKLKQEVNDLVLGSGDSGPEVAAARNGYDTLGDRLDASDMQLVDLKQAMIASWHGVDSSIGNADATNVLNALFSKAKTTGKRYVYFDEPHTYIVNGDLTQARDLILIGAGAKIQSNSLQNYFIQISSGYRFYEGKFNSYSESDTIFRAVATALKNKTVNVTIWGDSISTGGSDVLGIKYGDNNTGATQQSPTCITPGDTYYSRLIDMLTRKFQDVTFNFYNRAVSGAMIQNIYDNQTFNGVTKVWTEHIADTNPDLLIVAFGMNTTLDYSRRFRYGMNLIKSFANGLPKKPSMSWVTTPRPTLALDQDWGTFEAQLSRTVAAHTARYVGANDGYVLDAGRVSDIKRTGMDALNPVMREKSLTGIIGGDYQESGGVYTLDSEGKKLVIDSNTSDFVLEFDMNIGQSSGGSLWLSYNEYGNYSNVFLIGPNSLGVASIASYANYTDADNFPGHTSQYSDTVPWDDSVWRSIRIEKRAETVNLYVNGSRVIRDYCFINSFPGKINLIMNQTGATIYQIRNLKLYVGEYRRYLPTVTERDMYGEMVIGDYGTKPDYGGSGTNHPSTIGIEEVYCAVLREFVEDIAAHRWKYLITT